MDTTSTIHLAERDCGRPLSVLGDVAETVLLLGSLGAMSGVLLAATIPTVSMLGSAVLFGSCGAVLGGEIFVAKVINLKAYLTKFQSNAFMIALMMTTVAVALVVGTLLGILTFELAVFIFLFIAGAVALTICAELLCPNKDL